MGCIVLHLEMEHCYTTWGNVSKNTYGNRTLSIFLDLQIESSFKRVLFWQMDSNE
jgi:hypothetical protein